MSEPQLLGARSVAEWVVTHDDTALALGSGDVPVLATPRLLAWAEAATVAAIGGRLAAGQTSVGTQVELVHRKPSTVGTSVRVTAEVVATEGRVVRFAVTADDAAGRIATGTVTRAIVDRERFLRD